MNGRGTGRPSIGAAGRRTVRQQRLPAAVAGLGPRRPHERQLEPHEVLDGPEQRARFLRPGPTVSGARTATLGSARRC